MKACCLFKRNDALAGTEHTSLFSEVEETMAFRKRPFSSNLTKAKGEMMFIQLFQVSEDDADMIAVKEKTLNKRYKGLTDV